MAKPCVARQYRGRLCGVANIGRPNRPASRVRKKKIAKERMRAIEQLRTGLEPRIDPPRPCAKLAWLGAAFGGLTSKIHAVVDTSGLPVWLALTAGL